MAAIDPRTPAGVARIAHLSRLALTEAEQAGFGAHMAKILTWIEELDAVDTEGVDAGDLGEAVAPTREDAPAPSLSQEAALANAPRRGTDGFLVPAVLSE